MSKRVAVIGAGPAGLAALKELLEEGHDAVCFERARTLGGAFREDGVRWRSLRLTSSGLITAFSDFPVSPDRAGHMRAGEYVDYLREYSDSFGIGSRISFGTTVEALTRTGDGGWTLRVRDDEGDPREERYDAVAVCSGVHQHPHTPSLPGAAGFTGTVQHAADYQGPEQADGRRVLVVGAGESGADLAAEVSRSAAETVLSLRRGVAVVPRQTGGRPTDHRISRINHSAAHWIAQTSDPQDDRKRRLYGALCLPIVLLERVAWSLTSWGELVRQLPRGLRGGRPGLAELRVRVRTRRVIRRLLVRSGGGLGEQFGTKSDDFARAIALGRCRLAGPIARFDGGRVAFDDGGSFQADLVIFCTGFEPQTSFTIDPAPGGARYLHMFDPAIGPSLAVIGAARPAHGSIPPLAELQARYFALVASGERTLPSEAAMRESVARQAAARRRLLRAAPERLAQLVDYTSFCDELAELIGCKPTRAAIRRESPAFRRRLYAGPFVAAQYRLVGPHAKPAIARQVITGLPISHPPLRIAALYLRWASSRVLGRVLGPEFAPKLALARS